MAIVYLGNLPPIKILENTAVAVVEEICEKTEPKPLLCEIPEDLKFRYEGMQYPLSPLPNSLVRASGATGTTVSGSLSPSASASPSPEA